MGAQEIFVLLIVAACVAYLAIRWGRAWLGKGAAPCGCSNCAHCPQAPDDRPHDACH